MYSFAEPFYSRGNHRLGILILGKPAAGEREFIEKKALAYRKLTIHLIGTYAES